METLAAGQKLDHFEILEHLGSGAFSEVYKARDERNGRSVVLKCPNPALLGDQSLFERFRREVAIGRLLDHPNIQRALDGGETRTVPYLVLEYVEGERLRDYLDAHGKLAPEVAVGFAKQLASALEYAHGHHIYHRDLKPENVLATPDGELKIIDFGIALPSGRALSHVALARQPSEHRITCLRSRSRADEVVAGPICTRARHHALRNGCR